MKLKNHLCSLLLSTITILASCSDRQPPPATDQMIRSAKVMTIEAANATQPLQLVGRVDAVQTVEMSFQVGGPLTQLPVLEGASLKKGDLIASLELNDFHLSVREAAAQLKLATQDLERKRRVLANDGIAKSAVEDAETIQHLRQVQLEKAREALSDARLIAPFDAYVAKRYVDRFTNIRPLDPIVRLHDLSQLVILTSIPESLLATVSPERVLQLSATFDFLPDQTFPLTYYENRGDAEHMAQTYEVSFTMENPPESNILPGMTARVSLELQNSGANNIIAYLPPTAIVADASNQLSVWLLNTDSGLVSRRFIQTGTPVKNLVPVMKGLTPGDVVVTAGANQLIEGMRVEPINGTET